MPATPIIRVLASGDIAAAREMLGVFARGFEDPVAYEAKQPDDAYLRRLLGRDTFVAMIAEIDGRAAGALAGYVLPKFEQARSEFYIYDLAVDPAHHRQGIATALLQHLKQLAVERGIYGIFVQGDYGDAAALALYDKHGTREEVLHFDIAPVYK